MEGMVVTDYTKDFAKASKQMSIWMKEGILKTREDVYKSIENLKKNYERLFSDDKKRKLVLKVIEN